MSFLGRKVKIQTADYTVEGVVAGIENQRLILSDVKSISTGERLDKMIVEGSQITDVDILEDPQNQSPAPQKPVETQVKQSKEIQDAKKEFDFAANLDKFDKKAEFEKIANSDQVAPTVSDKIPHNEMISGGPLPQRKGVFKLPTKQPKKQTPVQPANKPSKKQANSNDITPVRINAPNPVANAPLVPGMTPSPVTTPSAMSPNVSMPGTPSSTGPSLNTDMGAIPIATALQLSQIHAQMSSLGFNQAATAERAAEGIQEILKNQKGPIVLLVGTHAVGHWAIAAGRRLALRGTTVIAVSPANDAPEKLADQTKSFVAAGGHFVTTQKALFAALNNQQPEIVIDALEGFEMPLVDQLDENEFAAATWLINWATNAPNKVSLCAPSLQNSQVISFGFPIGPSMYTIDIGIPVKALMALKLRRFGAVRFTGNVATTIH